MLILSDDFWPCMIGCSVAYMQRGEKVADKETRRAGWVLRRRNVAELPQPANTGLQARLIYVVRMRNMPDAKRDDWATYVKRERKAAGMTQQQLADAVNVARETIWRWETGKQKPEVIDTVLAVADALGADRDQALMAADLHPGPAQEVPLPDPRLRGLDPDDPVVQHIMGLDVDEELRGMMLDRRRRILTQRNEQDIQEIDFWAKPRRNAA